MIKTYSEKLARRKNDYLGMLVLYNVSNDASITQTEFARLVRSTKVDIKQFKAPKPANVFRRACEQTKVKQDGYTYVLKDLGYEPNFVRREIIAKKKGKPDLSVATVSFKKDTEDVYLTILYTAHGDAAGQVKYEILEFMLENEKLIHSLPIRESIRKNIEGACNGFLFNPGGGAYFVPMDKVKQLTRLEYFCLEIPNVNLSIMPVVPDNELRVDLRMALFEHGLRRTTELLDKIDTLVDPANVITAKQLTDLSGEHRAIKTKMYSYARSIGKVQPPAGYTLAGVNLKQLWSANEG